jgi:hypothetical protein
MGLLDLPLIVFRFLGEKENGDDSLIVTVDVTGDVHLTFSDDSAVSERAIRDFSDLCGRKSKGEWLKFFGGLFLGGMSSLNIRWYEFRKYVSEDFKSIQLDLKTTGIRECLDNFGGSGLNPVFFHKKAALNDLKLLDVASTTLHSSQALISTQMDWKGDISQVISPAALNRDDVFQCHVKGVELAMGIKAAIKQSLIRLAKMIVII